MHILLALLGTLVTLLVLLHRLADAGIELGGLNPFAWRRRRAWRQQFEANPVFTLTDPREIAAVLLAGLAKIDGDLSVEEKRALLDEFETNFSMSTAEAAELLNSTSFLLGDLSVLIGQLDELLDRFGERLSPEQSESLLGMLERIAAIGGTASSPQQNMLAAIRRRLTPDQPAADTWG
jgi:hypothetical protein